MRFSLTELTSNTDINWVSNSKYQIMLAINQTGATGKEGKRRALYLGRDGSNMGNYLRCRRKGIIELSKPFD